MSVYFIQDEGGEIKIGKTIGSARERMRKLQTGNPKTLTLLATVPGYSQTESELHARFAEYRMNGEWFRAGDRLLDFIHGVVSANPSCIEPEPVAPSADTVIHGLTVEQLEVIRGYIDAMSCKALGDKVAIEAERYPIDKPSSELYETAMDATAHMSSLMFSAESDEGPYEDGLRAGFATFNAKQTYADMDVVFNETEAALRARSDV